MDFGVGEHGGLDILITALGKVNLWSGSCNQLRSESLELEYKCIGYAFGLIWDTQCLFRV